MSNTIPYEGDKSKLPHCKKCSNDAIKEHTLNTVEHPYRMKTSKELKAEEKESKK